MQAKVNGKWFTVEYFFLDMVLLLADHDCMSGFVNIMKVEEFKDE